MKNYFTYITTNPAKTVLYIGMTNNLKRRMIEHFESKGNKEHFAGKYYCYNLIWYEIHNNPLGAIKREKELKGWTRQKKEKLIDSFNPNWRFLNDEI
jgi:putative endonuclease